MIDKKAQEKVASQSVHAANQAGTVFVFDRPNEPPAQRGSAVALPGNPHRWEFTSTTRASLQDRRDEATHARRIAHILVTSDAPVNRPLPPQNRAQFGRRWPLDEREIFARNIGPETEAVERTMKLLLIPEGRNFLICLPTHAPTPTPPHTEEFDARFVAGYRFLLEMMPKSGRVVVDSSHARSIMRGCVTLQDSHPLRRRRRKSQTVLVADATPAQPGSSDKDAGETLLNKTLPSSTATEIEEVADE
jgi:hypothetical protein